MKAKATTPAATSIQLERVALAGLHEDPANVRRHNERNVAAIRNSLKRFGQRGRAVVAKSDGTVIAGNGLIAAARELGWSHVDVHYSDDLTSEDARAFAIADNRSGELSFFDEAQLAEQLAGMSPDLVELIGFDAGDMADLSGAVPQDSDSTNEGGGVGSGGTDRGRHMNLMRSGAMVKVAMAVSTAEVFEQAMLLTGHMGRAEALAAIAQHYIDFMRNDRRPPAR